MRPRRHVHRPRFALMEMEHLHEPLLPLRQYLRRLVRGVMTGVSVIGVSLGIGVVGYHTLGHLGWVDSILNASMILTGMGPVDRMDSTIAKLFASAYAIFSGVAFLTSVGILFAPVLHRFLHQFHLDTMDDGTRE